MPVLMTAHPADLDVVRAVATGLSEGGGEIRCYLEDDDHLLRNIGCKIAVGRLDDADTLASALTNVHTFLMLAPDPLSFEEHESGVLQATLGAWATAAREAKVAQNILVIGAALPSEDPIATVMASAASSFDAIEPMCIIESCLVLGEERPIHSPGASEARVLPLEDLVRIICQVDDRESTHGSVRLGGEPMPVEPPMGCPPERFEAFAAASLRVDPDLSLLAPLEEQRPR